MAKEFSKPFYRTKAWKDARRIVLHRAHWMCERCGKPATEIHHRIRLTPDNMWDPRITLNPDNLEALCHECHLKEHTEESHKVTRIRGEFPEYEFGPDGYLVEKR